MVNRSVVRAAFRHRSIVPVLPRLGTRVSFSIRRLRAAVRLVHRLPNEAKTLGKFSLRPTAWSVSPKSYENEMIGVHL